MSKIILREKAIQLRSKGKTYREIRLELNVPKSTLSGWLQNYPVEKQALEIYKAAIKRSKFLAIEKTIITKRKKRQARLDTTYHIQKKRLLPLSARELEVAGLFLYWGEGAKTMKGYIGVSNTNPKIIKFTVYWLTKILEVPLEKIRVQLHLYSDMEIEKEIDYWCTELKLPKSQFSKPYIKMSTREGLTYKGFGHGTCSLIVSNTLLREKVLMGIESIADYYVSKI